MLNSQVTIKIPISYCFGDIIDQNDEKDHFDILTYFRVPLDIKQQYLKSQYFVDVIENSFLFDFQITTYI